MRSAEHFAASRQLHESEAKLSYMLDAFGDTLAEREGWADIDGLEAVHLYLIRTHHWLPRDVQAMTPAHMRLALHVEMTGWQMPPAARG